MIVTECRQTTDSPSPGIHPSDLALDQEQTSTAIDVQDRFQFE